MEQNSNLLVFNFEMDKSSKLLSHQHEAVTGLAQKFNKITVITGRIGDVDSLPNVQVLSSNWMPGKGFHNVTRLLKLSLPIILRGDYRSVFFHMTDLQCALLSPLIKIRGRRQFLWYAHAHKSKFLVFSSYWVTNIVTSTLGSCPIKSKSVVPIGQAIDHTQFQFIPYNRMHLGKLVHIGRFDKSKNIDMLISGAETLKKEFPEIELTLIGSPGNVESSNWAESLVENSSIKVNEGWLTFKDSVLRSDIPNEMKNYGVFFHAYVGSLDKTLVESTMMGIPVISVNAEYLSIFGSWSNFTRINLENEYRAFRSRNDSEIIKEISRRKAIALENHSFQNWVSKFSNILQ